MKAYYHARAREYDDWWLQRGVYAAKSRPGWTEERDLALENVASLPPKRTLDVACGTGFVTRLLPGEIVGLDQSDTMLELAREQAPNATYLQGDGLELPFETDSFERVFTSHFYGHLEEDERLRFLPEARRVAPELVVFDAALHGGYQREEWQEPELGGGTIRHEGRWFVLVTA